MSLSPHRGRDATLQIIDERRSLPVLGIRLHEIRFNNQLIDLGLSSRGRQWRQTVGDSGARMIRLTGEGLMLSAPSDQKLLSCFLSGEAVAFDLTVPQLMRMVGPFVVGQLTLRCAQDDVLGFFVELQSAADIDVSVLGLSV